VLLSEQLIRRYRQFTNALPGGVEDGARDRRRDAYHRDLPDALDAEGVQKLGPSRYERLFAQSTASERNRT
jgi:hypothetical protein